ncbi:MAG: hypothetical protein JXR48_14105 [Candidatus Delongbacteria bacterium]|nr:hypothetical protein [Candidatus Delongbacteria bacterium]MBN2836088.1 hypothetical protein [Candidatus Delongbacteria bacterium]
MLKKIIFTAIVLLSFACTQKFDDSGFSITEPDAYPVVDTLTITSFLYDSAAVGPAYRFTNYDRDYLGTVLDGNDTLVSSEVCFAFKLQDFDYDIDSAFIAFPLYNDSLLNPENLDIRLSYIKNSWSEITDYDTMTINSSEFDQSLYSWRFGGKDDEQIGGNFNKLILKLPADSLQGWYDQLDGDNKYFYGLKLSNHGSIEQLLRLYSSEWSSYYYRPYCIAYHQEEVDSITTETVTDTLDFTADISKIFKAPAPESEKILIGGITGEGRAMKIDFSELYETSGYGPEDLKVLAARVKLHKFANDSTFIDIGESGITDIAIYMMSDSLWYSESKEVLAYDTLQPWIKMGVSTSSTIYFDIDTKLQKWIKYPDENYGFFLKAKGSGSTISYSTYDDIKIEVMYLKYDDGEE